MFARFAHPARLLAALFTAAVLGVSGAQAAQVLPLNPPQPVENDGKVEVIEFFAYGCHACANAEPMIHAWLKKQPPDVKFRRVPSVNPVRGIDSIPLFFALEAMGQVDRLHQKIFDAANLENVMLGHQPTLLKWLDKNGVKPADYESMLKSFSVDNKIKRAQRMNQDYRAASTPFFVVDGRYALSGVGPETFQVIDQLVEQTRQKMKAAAAPAAAPAAAKAVPVKAAPAKDAVKTKQP
ncbi:MAG: thiol:disulfide interchange protein DsbA/DsbL [Betaproteobacteria bacterium]|nr:thiol:disulfide interchange protein DsbA/DsbL [Betaproteobacteria bacterium]